jgi:hypothetical protein
VDVNFKKFKKNALGHKVRLYSFTSRASSSLGQDDVGRMRCRNIFGASITEFWQVDAGEKVLPAAEKDRGDGEVQLVDESCTKVLPNRGDAAAEPDILAAGSIGGALKYSADIVGNEVEYGAAIHRDRWPSVVGQHKDLRVVRRIVAPPSLPRIVGPRASDRSEHIAPYDPRTNVVEPARYKAVIYASRAALISKHLLKRSGGEGPFVQRYAADTERIVEILVGAGAIAVEGYGEGVNPEFGHGCGFFQPAPVVRGMPG